MTVRFRPRELHMDGRARDVREIGGARGDEQRKRRIRDRRVLGEHCDPVGTTVVQEHEHTVRLHRQREITAVVTHTRVRRGERLRRNRTLQRMRRDIHIEQRLMVARGLRARGDPERRHATPRAPQTLDVDVGDREPLTERLRLREHGTVLGDDLLSANGHVTRRIALSGTAVRVAAQQTRALSTDQSAAVDVLLKRRVRRGAVADDRRTRQREMDRRWVGDQISSQISYPTHNCGS